MPVSTPTWIIDVGDGTYGFWTSSASGKAKRLAHTSAVRLQPCDARGRVLAGTEPVEATARLVAAPDDAFTLIKAKVVEKYGIMTKIAHVLGVLGGIAKRKPIPYADRCVVITVA